VLLIGTLAGSMSREFRASRGVRLSMSRLSFSGFQVSGVGWELARGYEPASLRRLRWGFSLQHIMIAFIAMRMAKTAVRADCTAMRTTPVTVCVVCAIPSSSTKTRIHTTERARTTWMKMLMTLPLFLS